MKKKSRDYRKFTRSLKRFDKFCGRVKGQDIFIIINKEDVVCVPGDGKMELEFKTWRGKYKFDKI